MQIVPIPSESIDTVWDVAEPLLAMAMVHCHTYTTASLKEELDNADSQLWLACDEDGVVAAYTTKIYTYPETRECLLTFCGGTRFEEWAQPLLDVVEPWARENGCSAMILEGRKGWEREARKWGFEFQEVKMRKPL